MSTTNESTTNFTKTEQVLVTFLFLFSTVWLCKYVLKKMFLSHSFIRSTAFIKTFHHLGLFEKWSTLDPKTFYAIPFQKLVFLIYCYLEVLGKRQSNKKKSWFLVNYRCFCFAFHANLMSDGKKQRLIVLFLTLLILLVNMSISLLRWTVKLIKTQKFFAAKTTKLCCIILVSKTIEFYRYTENEKSNT